MAINKIKFKSGIGKLRGIHLNKQSKNRIENICYQKMKNYNIKKKITIGFGMIMVVNVVFIICLLFNIGIMSQKINRLYHGPFSTNDVVWDTRISLVKIDRYMYRAMLESDEERISKFLKLADDEEELLNDKLSKLNELQNFNDAQIMDEFEKEVNSAFKDRKMISESLMNGDKYAARAIMDSGYKLKIGNCEEFIKKIYDLSHSNAVDFIKASDFSRNITFIIAFLGLLFLMIICFNITKYITHSILEGINHVADVSNNLASGILKVKDEYDSNDEMGIMSRNLNGTISILDSYIKNISRVLKDLSEGNLNTKVKMKYSGDFLEIEDSLKNIIISLNGVFSNINSASCIVSKGAKEISMTGELLSEGSDNQAKAIEEVVKSIIDISDKIKDNTKSAIEVDGLFDNTAKMINNENEKMSELLASMDEINQSSEKINMIIDTIKSIADDINLLALNAAIESARAGEYGKGFAVVADEISKLARQSQEAVKSTTAIINNSMQLISNSSKIVNDISDDLNCISDDTNNVLQLVKKITASSEEQLFNINLITGKIDDIACVIESNLEIVEKTKISANELAKESEILDNEIRIFNLGA